MRRQPRREPAVSIPPGRERPSLRYRRLGGGYRREDVEAALEELRLALGQLDDDVQSLRARNRELEDELAHARGELESVQGRELELARLMSSALARAAEIEQDAEARAREVLAAAEESALRLRAEASRRVEQSSAQFNELLRVKDKLLDAMRGVLSDFDQAITRIERGERLFPGSGERREPEPPAAAEREPSPAFESPPPEPPEAAAPQPRPRPEPPLAAVPPPATAAAGEPATGPGARPRETESPPALAPAPVPAPPAAPGPAAGSGSSDAPPTLTPVPPPVSQLRQPVPAASGSDTQLFETRVEIEAGPFADFASLSAFERALAHLPKVEDVYVRRLADERALIELTLSEPTELLATMRDALSYAIDVRSTSPARLVLDVRTGTAAGLG